MLSLNAVNGASNNISNCQPDYKRPFFVCLFSLDFVFTIFIYFFLFLKLNK